MHVLSSHAIRELEQRWGRETGLPTLLLMERAALGCWDVILRRLAPGGGLLVAAGPGNNGGDGLAIARLAAVAGVRVDVVLAAERERLPQDAAANLAACVAIGVPVYTPGEAATTLASARYDVVVDALLGIGQCEPPRGLVAEAMLLLHRIASSAAVIAVDVPTGVDADTGRQLCSVVRATHTVTFHGLRPAHALPPAVSCCGEVHVADIGIPAAWDVSGAARVVDRELVCGALRPLPAAAHKGVRGHILVVAGSDQLAGAAALTARAVLRAGAGLVTVATTATAADAMRAHLPEAMWLPRTQVTADELERFDGFVVGPGLGSELETRSLVARVLEMAGDRPVVVDADALHPELLTTPATGSRILTPHPGELARLLGEATADVVGDLPTAARAAAARFGATVVAKTAGAWVCTPEGDFWVPPGSGALGVGGSGDVLAGAMAAIAVRQGDASAAWLAAWLHQQAGRIAAGDRRDGLLASEVADAVASALAALDVG